MEQLAESVLIPSRLTAAASAAEAGFQNKIFVSGTTALIISNEKMEEIMKITKSLEEYGLIIKCASEN